MKKQLILLVLVAMIKPGYSVDLSGWPEEIKEISYFCSGDSSFQPALYFCPDSDNPRPLLVALHTWSGDYTQETSVPFADWCIKNDWIFIHPDFRGVSNKPEATGSPLAIQDIKDAVSWVNKKSSVDLTRIYLVGASGGGFAGLLAASYYPEIWTAISVWVPLVDLESWYYEGLERNNNYPAMVDSSCGGKPGESEEIDWQYKIRSPKTHLFKAIDVPIDLNAGIFDGHEGSVPVHHSIWAFNILADSTDQISKDQESFIVNNSRIPVILQETISDPSYGKRIPLFRRKSRNVRLTIFKGGHEIIAEAALKWLSLQEKTRFK
jgi:pimeloyl-ACP methyl ester carboxylesterase